MIVQCPECDKRYRIDDEKAADPGLRMRCAGCGQVFGVTAVPGGEEAKGQVQGEKRIVACDDAPFFRAMLSEVLTEAGFSVETASGGEEALALIADSPPDLLIVDLQMPGMSGFDVIKALRKDGSTARLPILAVSAVYTDSSDMIELQDAGADDYISKKFKPEHLVKRVRRLLGMAGGE